jgi:glycosyltransferase involved in cell wall biosynthesis
VYEETALASVFADALLCVYPANAGLSVVHAMGYGCPVLIGSNLQAHGPEARFVKEGYNGHLYPPGSAEILAARVTELRSDPAKWNALSAAASDTAGQLDTAAMAKSMYQAVDAVRRRSGAPS